MDVFLAAILSFPTVVLTALLGVVVVYWLLVVLGALDLDVLGGKAEGAVKGLTDGLADGALEGATKGIAEGAFEGASKGLADGALEGATKGVAEGATHGAGDALADHGGDGLAGLVSALRLRAAPVTVVASLIVFFAWLLSTIGTAYAGQLLTSAIGGIAASLVLLVVSTILAIGATSIAVRPLEQFFVTHAAPQHAELAGKVAIVTTGRVDAAFGQATVEDGGAGLLLQVRCDRQNGLSRGKKALLVSWESSRAAFVVEPYEEIVPPSDDPADSSHRRT